MEVVVVVASTTTLSALVSGVGVVTLAAGFIGNAPWAGGGAGRETKKTGGSGVLPVPHRSLRESGSAVFGAGRASDVFVIPSSSPTVAFVMTGGGGRVCVCARRAATAKCSFSTA